MPATPNITNLTGNAAAITIKNGFAGSYLIQNPTTSRIFINSSGPADDNSAFIPAAVGAAETLIPGSFPMVFDSPLTEDLPIRMALLSSNAGPVTAVYSVFPSRISFS